MIPEVLISVGVITLLIYTFSVRSRQAVTLQSDKSLITGIEYRFQSITHATSRRFRVDRKSILAIIAVESAGNVGAIGADNERGLMQITSNALEDINNLYDDISITWDDLLTSSQNIIAGSAYLGLLKWRYLDDKGNEDKAIRAYNVGASKVNNSNQAGQSYLQKVNKFKELIL